MSKCAILVGHTGALGSRVFDHLKKHKWAVLTVGRNPKKSPNFLWDDFFSNDFSPIVKPDLIINCASPNRQYALSDPGNFRDWMMTHGRNLARLSQSLEVAKSISFSTVHVYSDKLIGDYSEDTNTRATHPYAQGHLALERMVTNAGWTVLRIANTFGAPGSAGILDYSAVTNHVIRQILNHESITLSGDPTMTRDFLPIDSFLSYLDSVIEGGQKFPLLNIASGRAVEIGAWRDYIVKFIQGRVETSTQPCMNAANKSEFFISSRLGHLGSVQLSRDIELELKGLIEFFIKKSME